MLEDPECEDLEEWCKHEPECDHDDVQTSCPKLCGSCKGKLQDTLIGTTNTRFIF